VLVFLVIALAGLSLLLISAIFGGHDDLAADHDHAAGAHGEAGEPSPFSTRVICLFLTAFGAVGAIGRHYDLSYMNSSAIGAGAGLLVGLAGWQVICLFWRQQASSLVGAEDLRGLMGQVSTEIPAAGIGQISVVAKSQRMYERARAKDGGRIEEGAQVKILEYSGDTVVVERA